MKPKQIIAFREKHFPVTGNGHINKSRELMAKEFNTTARTIRNWESGVNEVPGIFVKAVELWLKVEDAIRIAKYPPVDKAILEILCKH